MANKKNKSSDEHLNFEASIGQLESIIDTLEEDGTTLEQALELFEQGIKLTRSTQKSLAEAEQKVQLLLEIDNQPVHRDLEEQG